MKDTSPLGVLLITITSILITIFTMKQCHQPNIVTKTNTITKNTIDTVYQNIHSKDTLLVNQYVYIKDTIILSKNERKQQIKQQFNIKDSLLNANIFTVANDTVNQIEFTYNFKQPTITITDSIIVTNTIYDKEYEIKYKELKSKQPERIINSIAIGILGGIIYNLIKK